MIKLANEMGIIPEELEYDTTWERGIELYKEFDKSKFNNSNEPEYECILEFLNSK